MYFDWLKEKLEDEIWGVKWVEKLPDQSLFVALMACDQNPGPVTESTRPVYNQMMTKLLKEAPTDSIRSIEKYLEANEDAKDAWFAGSDFGVASTQDGKSGTAEGGCTPESKAPPSPDRRRSRRKRASAAAASTPSPGQAPATPPTGKKRCQHTTVELRTRYNLRSAATRTEEVGSPAPKVISGDVDMNEPFVIRKRETHGEVRTSLSPPPKATTDPETVKEKDEVDQGPGGRGRALAGDRRFVNIFRTNTLSVLVRITMIFLTGVDLYYSTVAWKMLEELEEIRDDLHLD